MTAVSLVVTAIVALASAALGAWLAHYLGDNAEERRIATQSRAAQSYLIEILARLRPHLAELEKHPAPNDVQANAICGRMIEIFHAYPVPQWVEENVPSAYLIAFHDLQRDLRSLNARTKAQMGGTPIDADARKLIENISVLHRLLTS